MKLLQSLTHLGRLYITSNIEKIRLLTFNKFPLIS